MTLGRRGPRRPGDGDRPDGVRAPALQPRLGGGPAPAAEHRHRPDRLRRRLPRLGVPRGRRALRSGRGRAGSGSTWPAALPRSPADDVPTGAYATTIRHTRRKPFHGPSPTARTPGWSTSTTCRTTACLGRFEARDHLGAPDALDPRQRRGVPRRPRRRPRRRRARAILMAAHAAGLRLLLQPDQRLLVLRRRRPTRRPRSSRCTTPTATGTPTSSTPTSRAGPRTDKAMYVSPFHGTDGTLRARGPGARATGSTSRSRSAPTTAPCSAPRSSGRRPTRLRPQPDARPPPSRRRS